MGSIQVTLGWGAWSGREEQAGGALLLARDTRERPRDPYPEWYEWPICLRGYSVAPASEAREDPADEIYWYEWPWCLRGYPVESGDLT